MVASIIDFEHARTHSGDYMVRGTAAYGMVRAFAVTARGVVQTARDTYTHADEFFSARRLGADSGRIYTGIILRKPIDNKN